MRGTARVLRLGNDAGDVTVPVPKITARVLASTATRKKGQKLWRLANGGADLGVGYDAAARRGQGMDKAKLEALRVAFTRERAIALKVEVATDCVVLIQAQLLEAQRILAAVEALRESL